MGFTTGTGGTVGGPPTPTPREQETTAAMQAQRMMLGIVADGLERSLAHIDYKATWKYESSASNPTIAPLRQLRIALNARVDAQNVTVEQEYNRLFQALPDEIQARLLEEKELPIEQRNEVFIALDRFLNTASQMSVWANFASQPIDPELVPFTRIPQYQEMVPVAAQTFNSQSSFVTDSIRDFLNSTGHNDPFFDVQSRFATDFETALANFHEAQGDPVALSELSGDLATLRSQLKNNNLGDDLQVISHMTDTLSLLTNASTLSPGMGSLLVGLSTAHIGGATSGLIPDSMAQFSESAVKALHEAGFLPNSTVGNLELMPLLLNAVLEGTIAWASMTTQSSETGPLYFDDSLQFYLHSGLFQTVLDTIVASNGGGPPIGESLYLAQLLFLIEAIAQMERNFAKTVAESTRQMLDSWLENIHEIANRAKADRAKEITKIRDIHFKILQAQIALQQDNYDAFLDSIHEVAHLVQSQEGDVVVQTSLGPTIDTLLKGEVNITIADTGAINI